MQGSGRSSEGKVIPLEIKRQLFHLVLLSLWLVPVLYFPAPVTLFIMFSVLLINLFVVRRVKPFYALFNVFIRHLEREENLDRPGIQALYANLGVTLSFLLFGKLSSVGIVVLALGDSFSTLIGKLFGKIRIFLNERKTWEGSIAFFLGTYLILLPFLGFERSLLIAIAGSLIEAVDLPADDNLTIPIATTALAYLV